MPPIDDKTLAALLNRPEGPTLDFKETGYSLSNPHTKGEFIKDILAMANTPRDEPARIILGVKKHLDGTYSAPGLQAQLDDNLYQQQIEAYVYPTPIVLYYPVDLNGAKLGVIEIAPERRGPYRAKVDLGPVRRHEIYWRQGSKNAEAVHQEDEERIRSWVSPMGAPSLSPIVIELPNQSWERFLAACHSFEPERLYVLIAGPVTPSDPTDYAGLGAAPWFAVFDLDPSSASSGLHFAARPRLETHRQLHELVMGDRPTIHVDHSTYWSYARGLNGRATTLVDDDLRPWRLKYNRELRSQFDHLAAFAGSRPVTVVVACEAQDAPKRAEFLDTLLLAASDAFAERLTTVICTEGHVLDRTAEHHQAVICDISPRQLARGLEQAFAPVSRPPEAQSTLPGRGGFRVNMDANRRLWLEEDLEVLYSSAGLWESESDRSPRSFLCGGQISWFQLGMHDDVDRELAAPLAQQLRVDLGLQGQSAGTVRVNLYHEPGTGGSTLARRVLWDLHNEIPCALAESVVGIETGERVRYIYRETGLPVVLLTEGADVTDAAIEDLYSFLRSQQIPSVLLRVLRSFQRPQSPARDADIRSRSFFLAPELNQTEANRFGEKFARFAPERRQQLLTLARSPGKTRHPFFFGLYAFESDFIGLPKFITTRLDGLSDIQRKVLLYLSLAYFYGQKPLPARSFAELLGVPGSERLDLTKFLAGPALQLLQDERGYWRPIHHLVAEEIIRQLLNPAGGDPRLWKQNLGHWAIEFAQFCRGDLAVPSNEMLEVISRCFLLRDSRDFIGREEAVGTTYARLIEDILSLDGKYTVLLKLTDLFPEEPHIWAHLGRFVFREKRDPVLARQFIDKGIELSPDDHVLYHIKGMAFRSECYDVLDTVKRSKSIEDMSKVTPLVKLAAEQFRLAREKGPQDEHSYISHIQMLLRLIDTAKTALAAAKASSAVVHPKVDAVVKEAIDEAEDLLERARLLREGERPSEYTIRCAAELDEIYGNFSAVLQAWDGLLQRQDVYKPPIRRQLVRAYLARQQRRWTEVPQHEVQRSVALLEQNLLEEPGEEKNLRLWVQAVRRVLPRPAISKIVERVAYWRANSLSVDAAYYLYVFHAIQALDGSTIAARAFEDSLTECKRRARERRNRTGSFEWVGQGREVERLVHYTELGRWEEPRDFWSEADKLARIEGRIARIAGPEAGTIEASGGLHAFFVPGRSGHVHNRDENRAVTFYLGFSYDGPRAWEVKNV